MNNNSTSSTACQVKSLSSYRAHLSDLKAASRVMARLLDDAAQHNDARYMYSCGDTVITRLYDDGHSDIAGAIYCHRRLCPMCQWRRALKSAGQLSAVMDYMDGIRADQHGKPYAWIALTYSPRNVIEVDDVADAIDRIKQSWTRLTRTAAYKDAVIGSMRCIEIRQSDGAHNPAWRGTWQVHIHSILCVEPSYFHGRSYISRDRWGQLLAQSLDIAYIPQFHVERIDTSRNRLEGSAAETAKYCTKLEIGLQPDDMHDLRTLAVLNETLYGQHMIQYYGSMRRIKRILFGDDDPESDTADLADRTPTRPDLAYILVTLHYTAGVGYVPATPDPYRDRLILQQLTAVDDPMCGGYSTADGTIIPAPAVEPHDITDAYGKPIAHRDAAREDKIARYAATQRNPDNPW